MTERCQNYVKTPFLASHPSFSKVTHPFLLLSIHLHLQQTNTSDLRGEHHRIIECLAEWSVLSFVEQPAFTKWKTREIENLTKAIKRAWDLGLELYRLCGLPCVYTGHSQRWGIGLRGWKLDVAGWTHHPDIKPSAFSIYHLPWRGRSHTKVTHLPIFS